MQSTIRWNTVVIWAAVAIIAALSCSLNLPAARLGNDYVPVGNDSFYHARRILDAVHDPAGFYQFDSKIHAPEGSLLVWPWGYDYAMAGIVRLGLAAGISSDPMAILAWIPVAAVFLSIALLIAVARQLSLSSWPVTLAALCMALAPTTQLLHGVGQIDHHYAELLFVLGSLAAGLAWLRSPTPLGAGILGAALGLALAVHNGLFILQIPLLATVFVRWLQGANPPRRSTVVFAVALVCSTLAVLIPSLSFRMGRFEFYTLSWFHLYVGTCTALLAVLLGWLQPRRAGFAVLAVVGIAMLIPVVGEIGLARSFLAGTLTRLDAIGEMKSPLALVAEGNGWMITNFYSYLIWAAPLTALLCVVQCWRERRSPRLLFWISCVCGLALLAMQVRMHYFGNFALYLPWLVLVEEFAAQRPDSRRRVFLIASLALLLLYIPLLRHQLIAPNPPGGELWFERVAPIFPVLREACAEDPGVVFADSNAGHYIRYYTDCSVIADNFLLTPQHFQKIDLVDRLSSLPAQQLVREAPYVKYVLIRPVNISVAPDGKLNYAFVGGTSPRLALDLLFAAPQSVPPEYRLIGEIRVPLAPDAPYARLYKIQR